MTRKKRGGNKPPSKGSGTPKGSGSVSTPPFKSPNNNYPTTVTLRDAVRSLEHKQSFWAPDTQLRHKGISFVSAGSTGASFDSSPNNQFEEQHAKINGKQHVPHPSSDIDELASPNQNGKQPSIGQVLLSDAELKDDQTAMNHAPYLSPAVIAQQAPKRKSSPQAHRRTPSLTPSNSSEDIVVFGGRNRSCPPTSAAQTNKLSQPDPALVSRAAIKNIDTSPSSKNRESSTAELYHDSPRFNVTFRRTVADGDVNTRKIVEESKTPVVERGSSSTGEAKTIYQPQNESNFVDKDGNAEKTIAQLLEGQSLLDDGDSNPAIGSPIIKRKKKKRWTKEQKRRNGMRNTRRRQVKESDEIQDDVLDDYFQNLKENGAIPDDEWEDEPEEPVTAKDSGWGHTELEDFRDLSTSEEIGEVVLQVLSRRERPSGLQYLVVWRGHSVDEARWIHHEALLQRHNADVLISDFEGKRQMREWDEAQAAELEAKKVADGGTPTIIVGSNESEDEPEYEDGASDNSGDVDDSCDVDDYGTDDLPLSDEADLVQRRKERMTDEHIARLLQRQEELGMHGDELLLFDGIEDTEDLNDTDPFVDKFFQHGQHAQPNGRTRRMRRKARGRNGATNFDSGLDDELQADDYGSFDVMDRDRPSLSAKAKSRIEKEVAAFELSDSDLGRQLADSWAADKQKKKAKKIERDELRAQGVLGSGSKKAAKAAVKRQAGGITMNDFEDELENFLDGSDKQLALPPLDKKLRKFVHEMANQFGLKSKSHGSGNSRYPILLKTLRTKNFDVEHFDRMEGRLSRRFGLDGPSARRGKVPKPFGGKNVGHGIADGQLVGAGAKEIGIENKGRAMLEKMGWSKGTALGALDNKGILMPIDSVMKKTKAGLG